MLAAAKAPRSGRRRTPPARVASTQSPRAPARSFRGCRPSVSCGLRRQLAFDLVDPLAVRLDEPAGERGLEDRCFRAMRDVVRAFLVHVAERFEPRELV